MIFFTKIYGFYSFAVAGNDKKEGKYPRHHKLMTIKITKCDH